MAQSSSPAPSPLSSSEELKLLLLEWNQLPFKLLSFFHDRKKNILSLFLPLHLLLSGPQKEPEDLYGMRWNGFQDARTVERKLEKGDVYRNKNTRQEGAKQCNS